MSWYMHFCGVSTHDMHVCGCSGVHKMDWCGGNVHRFKVEADHYMYTCVP